MSLEPNPLLFSYLTRLKLLYLGLSLIGAAAILYRISRPSVLAFAVDKYDYVEKGFQNFVFSNYVQIHSSIQESNRGHVTPHGDYTYSEWQGFYDTAMGVKGKSPEGEEPAASNWVEAKAKYENLLRSMLLETHFKANISRRFYLVSCLFMSLFGYLLLLMPSVDLFIRVTGMIFGIT